MLRFQLIRINHALSRYQVDFMQYTAQELAEELMNVD